MCIRDRLHAAGWPKSSVPVLAVGHQPTLEQVVAQLLDMRGEDCAVKKGAVWWLRQRERGGEKQTIVVDVQTAERL